MPIELTVGPVAQSDTLPADAGSVLLPLARAAIARELGAAVAASEDAPWLAHQRASFVTLTRNNQLRGCIGSLQAHRALGADVKANALAAAFRDPRFKPLAQPEYEGLAVEVSVLSPVAAMKFRDEGDALAQIRPHVDGIIFQYGHHRSTFLPQVWDQFSDVKVFMGHLKNKAGLPPDFWDPAVSLARYTVTKWSERQ
jgi:AmmeMemoRadiSam system protein A